MKIEISATGDYSKEELDVIVSEFEDLGFEVSADTTLFKKGVSVPPDVMICLLFVVGLAVQGFLFGVFQKMGEDTYDLVKKGVIKLFHKKKNGLNPWILLKIPVSKDSYLLGFISTDDKNVVRRALDALPAILEESKLKVSDVENMLPIYYDAERGWHFPRVSDNDQK